MEVDGVLCENATNEMFCVMCDNYLLIGGCDSAEFPIGLNFSAM